MTTSILGGKYLLLKDKQYNCFSRGTTVVSLEAEQTVPVCITEKEHDEIIERIGTEEFYKCPRKYVSLIYYVRMAELERI
jgi:hypothetical protein